MTSSEVIFLVVVIGALSLFAGALALASWEEGRSRRGKQ